MKHLLLALPWKREEDHICRIKKSCAQGTWILIHDNINTCTPALQSHNSTFSRRNEASKLRSTTIILYVQLIINFRFPTSPIMVALPLPLKQRALCWQPLGCHLKQTSSILAVPSSTCSPSLSLLRSFPVWQIPELFIRFTLKLQHCHFPFCIGIQLYVACVTHKNVRVAYRKLLED